MHRLIRPALARLTPTKSAEWLLLLAVMCLQASAFGTESVGPGHTQPVHQAAKERRDGERIENVEWAAGPGIADLGDVAELKVCEGYVFTSKAGAKIFMEVDENFPAAENLLGVLAPPESDEWYVSFQYRPGEKRDESDRPNADALLRTLRQEDEAANAIRRSRGEPEIRIVDWELPPSYQGSARNLIFATKVEFRGERCVNYTIRTFGPTGAIDAQLVADAKDLPTLIPTVTNLVSLLQFKEPSGSAETRRGEDPDEYDSSAPDSCDAMRRRRSERMTQLSRKASRRLIGGLLTGLCAVFAVAMKKFRYL